MPLPDVWTAPSEVGERLLDRIGLAGMLIGSAAVVSGDFFTALDPEFSLAFTALETALLVPWAFAVFRLDRRDFETRNVRRWPIKTLLAVHGLNVVLLGACLYEKWAFVLAARAGTFPVEQYRIFTAAAYVLVNVGLLGRGSRVGRLLLGLSEQPARLTAMSFGLTGLLGGLVLNLPQALRHASDASFIDGLFTAVSAVCVTGLVVHGTAETYTPFGQAVIFCLIQAGGLGIMVLYSAFAILAGRRLRVRSTAVLAEMVDAQSLAELKRTIVAIVVYTVVLELVGAFVLYALFAPYPDTSLGLESPAPLAGAGSRLWAAAFHSVSAFCNAGFTIFRRGAEPFSADWGVSWTIMVLIVLGGVGFPVLSEIGTQVSRRLRKERPDRLSLHCRIVLLVSALLIGVSAVLIFVLELGGTLEARPLHEKVLTSLFQSVTARTAGFNTLPIGELSASTLMVLCLVMFIGASPGSTGGGVKTTTIAVLFSTFRAELAGRESPTLLDRRINAGLTQRAVGVFFLSIVIVSLMVLLLLIIEPQEPLDLAFEAFSAFATVGLSTGVTGELSEGGKLVVILTMFVGRTGPMTLALALAARRRSRGPRLAEEMVTIG